MAATDLLERSPAQVRTGPAPDGPWYAGGVLVGAALIVTTALMQPFSYDELTQIAPYASDSITEITGATRQPPLDPLLGALVQHLLGTGQLQQRLVPVLAGIGTLVVMSLLLRRLHLGRAGAFAVWVMATTPLMVRFSAYSRPYALPLFLMLVFAFAAQRWLDRRRLGWLAVTALAAVAMLYTRVPEPMAFLLATALTLGWFAYRRRLSWSGTLPLVAVSLAALAFVGYPMYQSLKTQTEGSFFDPTPSGVVERAGNGVHEILTSVVPLLASQFPWWPITATVLLVTVSLAASRRRLFGWPMWWAFLAAPVAFVLAYHFLNPFSFDSLPYRSRAAFFFVPGYVFVVAALASVVAEGTLTSRRWRTAVSVFLAGVFLGQLPATADVVLHNSSPDFAQISQVLTADLPDDAIVLYDRPTPVGQSREPFMGAPRYMGDTPYVESVADLAAAADDIPRNGPVYVLVNGQCAYSGRCLPVPVRTPWEQQVPGWQVVTQVERFALYEPTRAQPGMSGVIEAMAAFGDALGPELGYQETLAAADLLKRQGEAGRGVALVQQMYSEASPEVADRIRDWDTARR